MSASESKVEVTAADRQLFIEIFTIPAIRQREVLDGACDARPEMLSLARHRLQSEACKQELVEALHPFARFAEVFDDVDGCTDAPDHLHISRSSDNEEPTIGDCRRARTVLAKHSEAQS